MNSSSSEQQQVAGQQVRWWCTWRQEAKAVWSMRVAARDSFRRRDAVAAVQERVKEALTHVAEAEPFLVMPGETSAPAPKGSSIARLIDQSHAPMLL
jgi:hypothetical protein